MQGGEEISRGRVLGGIIGYSMPARSKARLSCHEKNGAPGAVRCMHVSTLPGAVGCMHVSTLPGAVRCMHVSTPLRLLPFTTVLPVAVRVHI